MYNCEICKSSFKHKNGLKRHCSKKHNGKGYDDSHKCKFCGKEFLTGQKLGSHVRGCKLNPNYKKTKAKIIKSRKGKPLSESQKQAIRNSINAKVKEGTWHYSFSKTKTYKYKGIRLYGSWELNYAKWLDENEIKWRRPKESFAYEFEGKERRYVPDFYLIEEDLYVEIKGYETDKDRAKWSQFPFPNRHKVLKGTDLEALGIKI